MGQRVSIEELQKLYGRLLREQELCQRLLHEGVEGWQSLPPLVTRMADSLQSAICLAEELKWPPPAAVANVSAAVASMMEMTKRRRR